MGKVIVVEPQQLIEAANKISNYAATFQDIYEQLLENAGTMGEAWQGADNQAYVEKITGLTSKLKAMVEKLEQASTTLTSQSTNYSDRRQQNITEVNSLTE